MTICFNCEKNISFFNPSTVVEDNLICGDYDNKRSAKKKKDVLVFKPKFFHWYFGLLIPSILTAVSYISLSQQQELGGTMPWEWEEKINMFILCSTVFAIGLLVFSSLIIEHWGIELF